MNDSWRSRLKHLLTDRRTFSFVSVLALGVLLWEVNALSARRYARYDYSYDRRFSLSESSSTLLSQIQERLDVTIVLHAEDPLQKTLRALLDTYRSRSSLLFVDSIDPDRESSAYQTLLGGLSVNDAALVVRSANGRAPIVIERSELSTYDQGKTRSNLERALSSAIAQLTKSVMTKACFIIGHGEPSLEDRGPNGLYSWARRLESLGFALVPAPLNVPEPERSLVGCDLIAVVAPSRTLPRTHQTALEQALEKGIPLLLVVPPLVDIGGRLAPSGLEELGTRLGVRFEAGFVVERDQSLRLPEGIGEAFYPNVTAHSVTSGLSQEDRLDLRVIAVSSSALSLKEGGSARTLLRTSPRAELWAELTGATRAEIHAPFSIAAASETNLPNGRRARAVVLGFSTPFNTSALQNPLFLGNRRLIENSLTWLIDRPRLIDVPDPKPLPAGLSWTEESLAAVGRFVLLYMPLGAATLGALLLFGRYRNERREEAP